MQDENAAISGAKIIAVSNRKGGSGKTTTSVNLSAALAHKGKRVLLVDTDPQGHSALSLGITPKIDSADLYSLLTRKATLKDVTKPTYLKKLFVVPGGKRLTAFERENIGNRASRMALVESLQNVDSLYDYVVIDTPPTLSPLTISSLIASTDVLVPMQAHFLAMEGLAEMIKIIKSINNIYNRSIRLLGVVPTFYQRNTRLNDAIIKDLAQNLGRSKILHPVRTNIALAEAPSHGKSIFQYKLKCNGAYDYLSLANQIEAIR